jgi:hypothetical protein
MAKKKTILVLHFSGRMPIAGVGWEGMNWVLALKKLGHDVWYVEDNGVNPYSFAQNSVVWDSAENIGFVKRMMERFDLGDRWAYWDPVTEYSWHGVSKERAMRLYGEADAIINLCGATKLREEHMRCPVRILIDTDPIYEQIKLAKGDADSIAYVDAHTHLVTIGENLGAADCPVPLGDRTWHKVRPPINLDVWPADFDRAPANFSSLATWAHSSKNIDFEGESYQWSKHMNFLRFLDLPKRTTQPLDLALITPNAEVDRQVRDNGWHLLDPVPLSNNLESYADFLRGSRGELSVAKDIYVRPRSGWFSDRSVCYLASGRPVIAQDTAFKKYVPTGEGLFAFSTHEEALAAIETINADYPRHQRAARAIAEEYFEATKQVQRVLDAAGL